MAANSEDSFSEKVSTIVTHGFLTIGLGLGRELGLFTAMAEVDRPATSAEIAAKAGCKERPVREWLHQMAVGSIVDLDETGSLYFLPSERRAALQSVDTGMASMLPYTLHSHAKLISVFKEDGPPGLTCEDTFHLIEFWERNRSAFMSEMMPKAIQMVAGLHEELKSGIKVVDGGTSRGHLCNWLATTYPNTAITGLDIHSAVIDEAKSISNKKGLTNVSYSICDASSLPLEWIEKYDFVVMNHTLHDIPMASKAVKEAHRILKKGGVLMVIEPYAHANPNDNMGNEFTQKMLIFSLYYCLSSSMAVPGTEAHGNCAGIETYKSLFENGGFEMESGGIIEKLDDHNILLACRK